MAQLLVSVRDAAEAQIALRAGVDVIDVKEPARGSLGAPDLETLRRVVSQVAHRATLSVALGELTSEWLLPPASLIGVQYAKFGLAGCTHRKDWSARWRDAIGQLPTGVVAVAVAYADWQSAAAPDPWRVLETGESLGCRALLIDTHSKSRGSLMAHVKPSCLRKLVREAKSQGWKCALAGSLRPAQIMALSPLEPDYFAVRSAACTHGRRGELDLKRVQSLATLVHQSIGRDRSVSKN